MHESDFERLIQDAGIIRLYYMGTELTSADGTTNVQVAGGEVEQREVDQLAAAAAQLHVVGVLPGVDAEEEERQTMPPGARMVP